MESFIYADMNKACREKDKTKIQHYGAFAAALSYIVYYANSKKENSQQNKTTILFRGIKLNNNEVDDYWPGTKIHLQGFTSTSKRFGSALKFAFKSLSDDQVPVVFEIYFSSKKGLFELTEEFTAFPGEDEVLV